MVCFQFYFSLPWYIMSISVMVVWALKLGCESPRASKESLASVHQNAAFNRRLRQCCGCSSSSCNRRLGSSIIIITTTTTSENCESNEQWNTSCVLVCIENDRADRLAGKVNIATGLRLGRSEVLRSSRHYLRAQSQGRHTIDRMEERGVERGGARRSS